MPQIFAPPHMSLIEMKGRDARDFLHRLTTVHVNAMQPGDAAPGFFLNSQGKVKAAFWLACLSPEAFLIEIEDDAQGTWKKELLAVMDQFTFAEQYALKDLSDQTCAWVLELSEPKLAPLTAVTGKGVFYLHHGSSQFGKEWVSVWGMKPEVEAALSLPETTVITAAELNALRILALRPGLGQELIPEVNPLEIGRKDGIADNKGCYPGQEVIEKIVALGAPARRLVLIEGKGPAPQIGSSIQNVATPAAEVGHITSVSVLDDSTFIALGIVKKIYAKEGNEVRFASSPATALIERLAPYA